MNAVTDEPDLSVSDVTGDEDTAIPLSISTSLVDTDGSESLVGIELSGVNGTLSAGTDNGGGSWTLAPGEETGLTVTPPADDASDFVITVESIAVDGTAPQASATDTINVTVNEVNDPPVVNDQAFDLDENGANGTIVGTLLATNVETFETLAYASTGTAFAIDSDGEITVADSAQLDYETTTVFNLTGTVTDDGSPPQDDTAAVAISVNPLNDNAPDVVDDSITLDELASETFDVLANDSDADLPAQTLTVSEVNGNAANVGTGIAIDVGGDTMGTLTINSDGSAEFVANPDATIEQFQCLADLHGQRRCRIDDRGYRRHHDHADQ
ncbi:MAG: Ig-like domain-containing protein [Gammaproteobacteria bacterium]|nr:Ig-like domain-containing protein [Gammaproteobacteria bacterium]